eukprot:Blabericola_migrator_1__2417@NODE_167_length_12152_cov_196_313198_g145_i0_p8_GENE_NODE_167_length_12152_cov_196_313198_g145_i0NODE_167_length_12152_cov_196_313198_g145_i0_p8_ORF_typecomplete_len122_score12_51_NODE_167_length_12152_cov_196_313198_g145_i053195684
MLTIHNEDLALQLHIQTLRHRQCGAVTQGDTHRVALRGVMMCPAVYATQRESLIHIDIVCRLCNQDQTSPYSAGNCSTVCALLSPQKRVKREKFQESSSLLLGQSKFLSIFDRSRCVTARV